MDSLSSTGLIFIGQKKFKDSGQLIYFSIFFLIQKKGIKRIKAVKVASRGGAFVAAILQVNENSPGTLEPPREGREEEMGRGGG